MVSYIDTKNSYGWTATQNFFNVGYEKVIIFLDRILAAAVDSETGYFVSSPLNIQIL